MNDVNQNINNVVGSVFLTQSRFITQMYLTSDMLDPKRNINYQEKIKYEITQLISKHIFDKFSKEIEKELMYDRGEKHSLELHIFSAEGLRLAVEYIISEMPQHKIDKIKNEQHR